MPYTHVINSFIGLQKYKVVRWKKHHKQWIEIWLEPLEQKWQCVRCGRSLMVYHTRRLVRLRDLNISKHRTYLWLPRYQVNCARCGASPATLAIARPYARSTRRFERWLFRLTKTMTVKDVSELAQVDWVLVKDAEIRYIRGLLRKRNLDGIRDLGIDEISEKKGHRYLTLVTDINKRRVIWVGRGRDRAVLKKFFCWFGKQRTQRIKCVVIDMHDPYEAELRVRCPRAKRIYDRFHIIKPLHLAIDKIRCRLYKELPPEGRRYIKNSRFLLLRRREDLNPKQSVRLEELLAVNETLNVAYILKEDLRSIFNILDSRLARVEFRAWKRRARESKIPELLEYLGMLARRRFGILNFFKHRKTNGLSEGFNNVAKTIKKNAYGFHDWQYFRLKILRQCGKLEDASVDRD